MSRALVVLYSDIQRQRAADWCWQLKDGTRVEFKDPQRTLDQNSLMWVLLTALSVQLRWHGQKLTPDDFKLVMLDALRREQGHDMRLVPNTENDGFVPLGRSSSDLSKSEMGELIELIYAFGAQHGVEFEPSGQSVPAGSDAGGDTADSSSAPSSVAAEQSGEPEGGEVTTQSPPQTGPTRQECIDKFMRAATEREVTVGDRLDTLEFAKEKWKEALPDDHDFVRNALRAAEKVAKGTMREAEARKYLGGLM